MSAYLALAVSVGLLAVLATWVFGLDVASQNNLQVWIAFIAWGAHYHSGGGSKGTTSAIACMIWGALVGYGATVLLMGPLAGLGAFAAPVAVGLGAALICLSSKVSLLATIPASVYGFASIFGVLLLKGEDGALFGNPEQAIVPVAISIVIGAAFGYVSEALANALTKKGGGNAEAAADPDHAG
ncbi:MAG TPA: DUF1097 domain-containing protein [Sphingomonadaceae bacterium]|nr:DUF1097 domain-containing protein [Sphingomonadaceae bacterium]